MYPVTVLTGFLGCEDNLEKLEKRIHFMNASAEIYPTQNALIDMDSVLNVGGFNLDRVMKSIHSSWSRSIPLNEVASTT